MPMQVVNLLPTLSACVGDQAKTTLWIRFGSLFQSQLGGQGEDAAQQVLMFGPHMGQRDDVGLGNHQKMDRCPGVDVMKSQNLVILMDFFGWNLTCDDFAKNAIG